MQKEVVGKEGGRNADHDHELIERNQATALFRRRNLCDIDRRNKNGSTDGHTCDNPRQHKHREVRRRRRKERRTGKQYRRDDQHLFASEAIAQKPGHRISPQRTPAQTTYRPSEFQVTADAGQVEILLDEGYRARDYGGVEAQQETADCHSQRDPDDIRLVLIHGILCKRLVGSEN